jgi:hypothetical protein
MSSASPLSDRRPLPTGAQSLQSLAVRPVQALGFWAAVVLPFVTLVLLFTGAGLERPSLLAGLLLLNVVGLVLGRGHNCE